MEGNRVREDESRDGGRGLRIEIPECPRLYPDSGRKGLVFGEYLREMPLVAFVHFFWASFWEI